MISPHIFVRFSLLAALHACLTLHAHASPAQVIARAYEPAIEDSILTQYVNFSGAPNSDGYPAPMINERGDILYFAYVGGSQFNGSSIAKVRSAEGMYRTAWLRGLRVPGESAYTVFADMGFSQLDSGFLLNPAGDLIFLTRLSGMDVSIANNEAIYKNALSGATSRIARKGAPAPGTFPTGTFTQLFAPIISSYLGEESVLTYADLGNGLDEYDRGIWLLASANYPLRLALEYAAPGTAGAIVSTLSVIPSREGPALYVASLSGGDVQSVAFGGATVTTDEGLWIDTGSLTPPRLVARKGQVISISGQNFVIADLHTLDALNHSNPTSTESGQVYFSADLLLAPSGVNAGTAILKWDNGAIGKVIRSGDSFIGVSGLTFEVVIGFEDVPSLIPCGDNLILRAQVAGAGVNYLNNGALIEWTPNGSAIIARARSQAVGVESGVIFTTNVRSAPIECNSHGDWTFKAKLQGTGVTGSNDYGIWVVKDSALHLLIREGITQIGDYRVVEDPFDGFYALKIDDQANIAFQASLINIPSPSVSHQSLITASTCAPPSVVVSSAVSYPLQLADGSSALVPGFIINPSRYLNRSGALTFQAQGIPSYAEGFRGEAVLLTQLPSCEAPCAADFDQNGLHNDQDLYAYLFAWFSSDLRADSDQNGMLSVADLASFLELWFVGC